MSELTSMKINPATDTDYNNGSRSTILGGEQPQFPHELKITLRNEELKKLQMDKLPQVDERLFLKAMVTVVGVNQDDSGHEQGRDVRITLQITDLKVEDRPAIKAMAAQTLFGPQHRE